LRPNELSAQFAALDQSRKETARAKLLNAARDLAARDAGAIDEAELAALDSLLSTVSLKRGWLVEAVQSIQTVEDLRGKITKSGECTLKAQLERALRDLEDCQRKAADLRFSQDQRARHEAQDRAEDSRRRVADLRYKLQDVANYRERLGKLEREHRELLEV
jgi:hypothetical protein